MSAAPFQCTVRGCGRPLERHERTWVCGARHAFDVARGGYVNLLQPQDRKSSAAGDTAASVEARSRLLSSGVGTAAIQAIVTLPETHIGGNAVVTDLGCGSGELLTALAATHEVNAVGFDLSRAAIAAAAKRTPALAWAIANVDRGIPLCTASASLVLSLHGRRHPEESRRVLAPAGRLIVAVPAPDDLIELRQEVLGEAVERDRSASVIAEHEPFFGLERRTVARERHRLERDALLCLLQGTYRGARTSAEEPVAQLAALDVTLASDVLIFRPK